MRNGHANGFANGHANGEANGHADNYFSEAAGRTRQRKAVIVGAGPVGCLAAIALAKKGWLVEVYEGRAGAVCFSSTVTSLSAYPSFFAFLRLAPEEVGRGPAFD